MSLITIPDPQLVKGSIRRIKDRINENDYYTCEDGRRVFLDCQRYEYNVYSPSLNKYFNGILCWNAYVAIDKDKNIIDCVSDCKPIWWYNDIKEEYTPADVLYFSSVIESNDKDKINTDPKSVKYYWFPHNTHLDFISPSTYCFDEKWLVSSFRRAINDEIEPLKSGPVVDVEFYSD